MAAAESVADHTATLTAAAAAGSGVGGGDAKATASAFDADQTQALRLLTATGLTEATAAALMARAVALERDVTRLTAAAAAAAAAKDCDAEAAAEAELKALMSSPQRWVEVSAPDMSVPMRAFKALIGRGLMNAGCTPRGSSAWTLRGLLALRVVGGACAAAGADAVQNNHSALSLSAASSHLQGCTPLMWALQCGSNTVVDGLLDLPRAYGFDANVMDTHGRSAVLMACGQESADRTPALIVRLLRRSSAVALNATAVCYADGTYARTCALHELLRRLQSPNGGGGRQAVLEALKVCCSEDVCPCDGTGLDLFTSTAGGKPARSVVLTTTQLLADAERCALTHDATGTAQGVADAHRAEAKQCAAAVRAGCAAVRDAIARVTAYAQGFAASLSGALRDGGVTHMPAPVQGIVAGYAFKPSPHASQWPAEGDTLV